MFLGVLSCGKNSGELTFCLSARHHGQNPSKPTKISLPSHLLLQKVAFFTFCVMVNAILIAHHGTLFESYSRDCVDMPRVRERPKRIKIDSFVTKRVRKSALKK